jgi:hypothetical protein
MIQPSAQRRHAPVRQSYVKHHLPGVWGRAAPPVGSARGEARSQSSSHKRESVRSARGEARSYPQSLKSLTQFLLSGCALRK